MLGSRVALRRLGKSHLKRARLERPLLPDHRRPSRHVSGLDRQDRLAADRPGKDPRCEHCLVHCGFEPAAVLAANRRFRDALKMAVWQMT